MYNKKIIALCCFFILGILIFSSIVIANGNGKPDLCEKFEDKKDKWEDKWENKEEEDKDWGDKWEIKRQNKIDKLDNKKDKFCDECDDNNGDDNGNGDNGDGDNGNGGGSNNYISTSSSIKTGNIPPVADASAGEPYIGFIDENIIFNGSFSYDPDGYIVEFIWEFSDGTIKEGITVFHSFNDKGDYSVILTVKDDDGAINSTNVEISIVQPNNPPIKPAIEGPSSGIMDTLYDFSIYSNDFDNDELVYYVDWDDGVISESLFISNGTEVIFKYAWSTPGIYRISAKSFDGFTFSEEAEFEIIIGVYTASTISDIMLFIVLMLILISLFLILYYRNREKPKKSKN
jgi:hypothetical protein